MSAPKGHPRYGGRRKGTPNRLTAEVRQVFEVAFGALQGDPAANLLAWAKANPTEFYKLAARLIPGDVSVSGPVALTVITGVPAPAVE